MLLRSVGVGARPNCASNVCSKLVAVCILSCHERSCVDIAAGVGSACVCLVNGSCNEGLLIDPRLGKVGIRRMAVSNKLGIGFSLISVSTDSLRVLAYRFLNGLGENRAESRGGMLYGILPATV